ncbi:hypothetical protein HID58_064847 [Brassica napus]|uniref:PGG domain-containing protein n=1 Tax=Brassica napus TaxID=3708 RepID=A0ABQ7ZBH8_BRANA|nr:hypothetical protein HID58_064847 [Brassica napus]
MSVPFVTTPLHVAAASGNIPFAKEMLNLKPSFARKLNTKGYSPLHLAVNMDQDDFVRRMICLDGHLARVKGRNGITPFHLLAQKGNADLVARCLRGSPECIQDDLLDVQNALHLAVIHDRFEVLLVLVGWFQRMSQRDADTIEYRVLNRADIDYNTPLHLAASKNDRQAYDETVTAMSRNEVNGENLTFLDILRSQRRRDAGGDLREDLDLEQIVAKTWFDILKSPFTFWTYCSTFVRCLRTDTSDEARGVFLIPLDCPPASRRCTSIRDANAGSVVMKQTFFILIWLFNALGFGCAILYTFCLIPLGNVSVNCKNALHLAVMNDRFEVVQVLTGCIQQKIKRNSTEIRVTRMPFVFLLEYQKLYMDRRLQQAAESGSISDLYALIDENPCILENIDAMPFVNTPLHIAAASGKIAFAVEMLNLKPSFAKKLNTNGCSPLHLAVEKDQQELVTWLLRIDPSLAGVKGREGITLFHLLVLRGNVDLVVDCLMTSPECIRDASVTGQNALHLAVMNDRFEVLQVLTGWIQRMSQKNARSIETHGQIDEGGELEQAALKTGCMEAASLPKLMKKTYDFFKSPITFWAYCSTHTRRISSDTSDEARGVFLIICTLLITATYQTSLQPPGGVTQSEGHAVMKQAFFIVLWVSNTIGFCCALFYTYSLLPARAYSVSHRVLCLVPAFSSVCFDGSFPKAMAEASDGST